MRKIIGKHGEILTLPVAILIWYLSPYLLRRIDPTAGAHDIGLFQTFLIATVGLFFGTALIWLFLKLAAPEVYKQLDDYLSNNYKAITTWERGKFVLSFYLGLLLAWVLLVVAFV
jgi:hypothetical protein